MSDRVREYIQDRVEGLTEESDEILEVASSQTNDFDSWSALKLILHSATVYMYTTVISDTDFYDDFYYIDALAGSGVSTYNENRCFLGSPLVAAKAAQAPFEKMYFIERNEDYAAALEDRLEYVFTKPGTDFTEPNDWRVIPGDANDEIPKVVSDIKRRSSYDKGFNYLSFIDNQGLNVRWDAIKSLTPKPHGDLLINLPISQGIGRNVNTENPKKLNKFYGRDVKQFDIDGSLRRYMRDQYAGQLRDRGRPVQEIARVDSDIGSFCYDMVYATRKTRGGNGYEKVIRYVKDFIEQVDAGDMNVILEILEGDQSTLGSYLPDNVEGVIEELPEEENDPQASLGDFGS